MPEQKNPQQFDPATVELIKQIVAAVKQPSELETLQIEKHKQEKEKAQAELLQANEQRKRTAERQLAIMEGTKTAQETCLHAGGRPNHSWAVFVEDAFGGFCICQKCQVVVRQESARKFYPKDYSGTIVFDTRLFSSMFQQTSESGIIG